MSELTPKDVQSALNTHEVKCEQRHKNIDQQFKAGERRMSRIEKTIWGLFSAGVVFYVALMTVVVMIAVAVIGAN